MNGSWDQQTKGYRHERCCCSFGELHACAYIQPTSTLRKIQEKSVALLLLSQERNGYVEDGDGIPDVEPVRK